MTTSQPIRRIGLLTGGGDCPGLNAIIRAVTKSAICRHGLEVCGIADGFLGLIEDRIRPLRYDDVSGILDRGGTILGASNKSNPSHFCVEMDSQGNPIFADVTDRVLATIERHKMDALICVGGDGTMSAAFRLCDLGVRIVGAPKTIDNDVARTDTTFGFDTAVMIASDAIDRIRTTGASHHRIMIVETMGRYAGWIALFAGAATGSDVVLIPEIEYDLQTVCDVCIGRSRTHRAFTLITVAEGARPVGGEFTVDRVVLESPESIRLGGVAEVLAKQIADQTHLETRATILGHVQRGGKPTALDRVLATKFGHAAVKMVMRGEFGQMAAIQAGNIVSVPIADVADRQKPVPIDHPLIDACRATGTSFGRT